MWRKKSGDPDAFYEQLCHTYFQRVYKYCYRMVRGQPELIDFVEECTQNTFLEARKQIDKLMKHPNVEGWLFTTARNLIRKSFRSMYAKHKYEIHLHDHIADSLVSYDTETEQRLEDMIDIEPLTETVLESLSSNEYQLYSDYFKKKLSIAQLSAKYGITVTNVTTRIYRLKKKIKNVVRQQFEEKNNISM